MIYNALYPLFRFPKSYLTTLTALNSLGLRALIITKIQCLIITIRTSAWRQAVLKPLTATFVELEVYFNGLRPYRLSRRILPSLLF